MLLAYFNGVVLEYDYMYLSWLCLALTCMQIFYEKLDFLFVLIFVESSINVHQIAWKNGMEKSNCRIHGVQVRLRLAGACNETVYILLHKHWSRHWSQWIIQNTIHIRKKYIFFLILTKNDRGRFEVSKKLSPTMQTPNCLHSAM